MTLQTYTIELKVNVDDRRHEALTAVVAQYARDILATGMLLSDGKGALVSARSTDAFYDQSEIELLEPSDRVIDPTSNPGQ